MKNKIKQSPLKRDVAAVYGNIQMAEDKWNPADIIAVKTSYDGRKVYKPSGKSSLQGDNSEMKNAVKLIDDFKDLYEYNKWIHQQFKDKNIIPISLKKTIETNPKVEVVDLKEVKSLEAFLKMDIKVTDIEWREKAKKCIINFSAPNFEKGFFDARGFEESGKMADIQIQLQQGKQASHGKVTLPVTYLITRLSKGTKYFNVLQSMRRKCFGSTINRNFFDYKVIGNDFKDDWLTIEIVGKLVTYENPSKELAKLESFVEILGGSLSLMIRATLLISIFRDFTRSSSLKRWGII